MSYAHLSNDEEALLKRLLARGRAPAPEAGGAAPPPISSRRGKKKPYTPKYLTEDELARLFAAIRAGGNVRDLAIFEVAYHRGLRAGEVNLIQLGHWRANQQRLYVTRLKNGNSGEYMVTDRESKALRAYLRKRPARPGALFLSRQGAGGIGPWMLDHLMKLYGAKAELPADKRHFHALRHSCATSLLDRDLPIEEVQDHLGHVDIRNTAIYAKVTNAKRRRKDEKLKGDW